MLIVLLRSGWAPSCALAEQMDQEPAGEAPSLQTEPSRAVPDPSRDVIPSTITLKLGEIRSLAVDEMRRVAVGDPDVVDVTVPSANEMLLQAKSSGTTNLILWDRAGQHVVNIDVVDRAPVVREGQLNQLLHELGLSDVRVNRENGKIFLMGHVSTQQEAEHLEQMLSSFEGVTNLVTTPSSPPPAAPAPLVKLSVQVVELSRKDLEKLGVKWSESATVTQPEATDRTLGEALSRWGTGLTRSSVAATLDALVTQNRARILSEPKLVTASGKEASSFIGLEVPIITATSFSTTTAASSASIEFKKTGVLLKMTP
ncbi:MAG: pilus assembly protein N-terminal domain-containing protein, partial [Candidatus Omnitrophica bacterium]|nr:pilus assembly protein N-terminal domain-containing protein [Candidatus Omnitrophota bacterium]